MKLSEIKGEKAIEVFADLLEPISNIFADEEVVNAFRNDEPKIKIIQKMLKGHSEDIIKAMAIIDDVPVEKYEIDFLTLPSKLIEFFNDEAVSELFTSQSQNLTPVHSGSVMENTKVKNN